MNNQVPATSYLATLKKTDITMLKSFAKPPPQLQSLFQLIGLVLQPTCPLQTWQQSRKMLQSPDFLNKMIQFNPAQISQKHREHVRKFIQDGKMDDGEYKDKMRKCSAAGYAMLMWITEVMKM